MRLICPNCGAQYEVADDVIPATGRDVQCSNCAHTWFETPGASEAREAGEDAPDTAAPSAPAPRPETVERAAEIAETTEADNPDDVLPQPAEEQAQGWSDADEDGTESMQPDISDPSEPEEPQEPEAPAEQAQRRPLSPSVSEILRQEAAREEARRIADAETSIESQPDLGLDRPLDRDEQLAEEARRRMARLRGEAAPAIGAATSVAAGARGEMLPDIEEINSSLRSETERKDTKSADSPSAEIKSKSGFRRGFMTVVLLAIIALLVYMFAPQISQAVPALEPALTGYVDMVNQGRLWLDLQLQALLPSGEVET